MRLPRLDFDHARVSLPVFVAVLGAVPPATLHAALASAAGTLFEAAPFVLAAEVLPKLPAFALESAGCGCGRRGVPGATSLPAAALCWLAFGPWIALGRLLLGFALVWQRRFHGKRENVGSFPPDPLADLGGLIVPTVLASLAAQAIGNDPSALHGVWPPLLAAAGAGLGALVPCATAGVAIAAGLAHPLPTAAGGLLVTAGFVRLPLRGPPALRIQRDPPAFRPAGFASVVLAVALAALACRGPAGLVNPRLLPLDAAAAVLAFAGAGRRRSALRAAPLLGVGLGCALVASYAVPQSIVTETTLDGAYPGQRIDFTGVARMTGTGTTLQRFAISCCRLDATAVAVRLTRRLTVRDGTWIAVRGAFVHEGAALRVRVDRWQAVPPPADPFVYR